MISKIVGLRNKAEPVPAIVFDGTTYFTTGELGCRCSVCQGRGKLAPGFRELLLSFRLAYGRAMPISSCCRCLEHNEAEGGSDGSYHIYETEVGTCAIDVRCTDSILRAKLVKLALEFGCRVGVNPNFIHIDFAPKYYPESETQKVFLY